VVLERILARQAGVITRAQALACGISADTTLRRVRSGAWHELHPGVYLVGGHPLTDEARVRAASLWPEQRVPWSPAQPQCSGTACSTVHRRRSS
jgi:hypothetical protein